jgi:hypothetical protein
MPKIRLTIEIDDELLERLEAQTPVHGRVQETIIHRLERTADYDLAGSPLFLDHGQHQRLRALTPSAAIRGVQSLLDDLEGMTRIGLSDVRVEIPVRILERIDSRAKVEGRDRAAVTTEYALAGIRERVGM